MTADRTGAARGVCRVPAPELAARAAARASRLLRARSRSPAERARAARPTSCWRRSPAGAGASSKRTVRGGERTRSNCAAGVETVCRHSPRYPARLRADAAPRALFVAGGAGRLAELAEGSVVDRPRRDAGERLRRGDGRAPRARARRERRDGGRAARRRRRRLRPPRGVASSAQATIAALAGGCRLRGCADSALMSTRSPSRAA